MVEFLISVQVPNTHLRPIQISILYNEDGSVGDIDWREAIDSENEDYVFDDECIDYEEWPDESSDEDPSWKPGIDTETEDDSDY